MLPKISCYSNTCWFVHDMRYGEHIAKVVYKDAKIEAMQDNSLFYRVVTKEQYDPLKHHYWNYIPEWDMFICNISAGSIQK